MMYKVLFTSAKGNPVFSHYRPDWCSESKPEYNCAQLLFTDTSCIVPGETHECLLQPLRPELWNGVAINDTLKCMEGPKRVGIAIVLEIISP